jgi:hypothetical protein
MIIFELICPLLKQDSFLGSWGSSKNWLELKNQPSHANLASLNW